MRAASAPDRMSPLPEALPAALSLVLSPNSSITSRTFWLKLDACSFRIAAMLSSDKILLLLQLLVQLLLESMLLCTGGANTGTMGMKISPGPKKSCPDERCSGRLDSGSSCA